MITLILGKPNSGKSHLAESIAIELAKDRTRYYIATMIPYGEEGLERVKKHRQMREGKGFITLEWPDNIAIKMKKAKSFSDSIVLLECVSNLVGNEMYGKTGKNATDEELVCGVVDSIRQLGKEAEELIVVTNEFDAEDDNYDSDTKRYIKLTDKVNSELVDMSAILYTFDNGEWNRYENN